MKKSLKFQEIFFMKVLNAGCVKVIIRKADKNDAETLLEYFDIIGGESDFFNFRVRTIRNDCR